MIQNAFLSLKIHLPFYVPLAVLLALRTMMQAVNFKTPTVVSSSIELGMKILAATWLIPKLGFLGTCVTEPITWVLCAIFLMIVYAARRHKIYAE